MKVFKFKFFIIFFLFFINVHVFSQSTSGIKGIILDEDNLEPISFAPVQFIKSGIGKVAEQNGTFYISFPPHNNADSLKISYIGYEPFVIPVIENDSVFTNNTLRILLKKAVIKDEVIVKSKFTKSFLLWRKVVRHKPKNNNNLLPHYAYNLHNRLELSLNDVNKENMAKSRLLKRFDFILKNTDSSEFGKTTLPFFITETLSDIYYQRSPYKKREEVKAIISSGLKNESMLKLLGGSYQNFNFYDNQITFFNKEFISPFANNADNYYKFKILDTQYVNKQRLIHFLFIPKAFADNVFYGDCWIRDSLYAIQKINMRLSKNANINFVNKANFMQEFQLINDSVYFLKKVSFIAEVAPTENSKIEFLVRKNTTYKSVSIDNENAIAHLQKSNNAEEVVLENEAKEKDKNFWDSNRHETLTKSEMLAHATIDTLWKMPFFIRIIDGLRLLQSGFLNIGKFKIGKWWSILGRNPYNEYRLRFELSNNEKLSKNFNFHAVLTINTKQELLNGGLGLTYIFNHNNWSVLHFLWSNNIDLGAYDNKADLVSKDNVFVNILRRKEVHFRIHNLQQTLIEYDKKFGNGLGFNVKIEHQIFTPIVNKTNNDFNPIIRSNERRKYFLNEDNETKNASLTVGVNYSYLEKWIENDFKQISLGTKYPIIQLSFTQAFAGIVGSQFNFQKLNLHVKYQLKKEPFGVIKMRVDAGKYWGFAPYTILERPFANLTMYEIKNTFNTVQPYEFAADEYVKLHIENNLGLGLLRFIPIVKKWKWRQIIMLNAMAGSLNNSNTILNSKLTFKTLRNLEQEPLVEIGTGIDNIFHIFRVSYFWRLTQKQHLFYNPNTFMFSFHLQF